MLSTIGFLCLAYFVVLINPLGWHMIIHVMPFYVPFLLKNISKINFINPRPVLYMFLFFIYTLISAIFISNGTGTYDKLLRYFYELLLMAIFFNIRISTGAIRLLIKFYTFSCVAVVIKMLVQRAVLPEDETRYTIYNFIKMMDPNFLTGLFVFPSIVLFYRIIHNVRRKVDLPIFVLLTGAILATGSRGGLVSVVIGCGILLWKDAGIKTKLIFSAVFLLLISLLSYSTINNINRFTSEGLNDGSNALRFHLWSVSWKIFMTDPIFGRGANSMINLGLHYGARINIMVHNSFLEILTDYGIIGFLLWFFAFWNILKKAIKIKNSLIISILLSTFFCAFFISAQDSAFWWQNIILCNAMLYCINNEVTNYRYNFSFK